MFDIHYFREHPEPFYYLAKELYPGRFHPTVSHAFIALLHRKGLLHIDFTQNIDCLERLAGVPDARIVEAHGSFATQRCIDCRVEFDDERMRKHVEDGVVPRCDGCGGLVKPDIVFFGEPLPAAFRDNAHKVFMTDLVIIIGTSLSVYPFAGLADMVPAGVPRLLLNMQPVHRVGDRSDDVVELGPCDDGVRRLADLLGWRDELEALWRSVVGDQEADRQLGKTADGPPDLDEEVRKLTEGVESGLVLTETRGAGKDDGESESEQKAEEKMQKEDSAESVLEKRNEESGVLSAESVLNKGEEDTSVLSAECVSKNVNEESSVLSEESVSKKNKEESSALSAAPRPEDKAGQPLKEDKPPAKEATSAPPKEAVSDGHCP